jgi:hypothetical protein
MANILAVAGPGSKYQLSGAQPAGFWAGLWHGIISPITFLVSLFNLHVRIYETHNRGRLYDFGLSSAFRVHLAEASSGSEGIAPCDVANESGRRTHCPPRLRRMT